MKLVHGIMLGIGFMLLLSNLVKPKSEQLVFTYSGSGIANQIKRDIDLNYTKGFIVIHLTINNSVSGHYFTSKEQGLLIMER